MSASSGNGGAPRWAPRTRPVPLSRRLSRPLTRVLLRLPFSPNQITLASLPIGLAGNALFADGGRAEALLGAVMLVVCYILDSCDGDLARGKRRITELGKRFDSFVDWAVHASFFLALGYGVSRTSGEPAWMWLAAIACAGCTANYIVGFVVEARDLRRALASGSRPRSGHESPEESKHPGTWQEWALFGFRELPRADFCFIVLALALVDLTWLLLPAAAVGSHVYWITQFARGAQDYRV
jgi:phosphatidylglycerophosphate synthase